MVLLLLVLPRPPPFSLPPVALSHKVSILTPLFYGPNLWALHTKLTDLVLFPLAQFPFPSLSSEFPVSSVFLISRKIINVRTNRTYPANNSNNVSCHEKITLQIKRISWERSYLMEWNTQRQSKYLQAARGGPKPELWMDERRNTCQNRSEREWTESE